MQIGRRRVLILHDYLSVANVGDFASMFSCAYFFKNRQFVQFLGMAVNDGRARTWPESCRYPSGAAAWRDRLMRLRR